MLWVASLSKANQVYTYSICVPHAFSTASTVLASWYASEFDISPNFQSNVHFSSSLSSQARPLDLPDAKRLNLCIPCDGLNYPKALGRHWFPPIDSRARWKLLMAKVAPPASRVRPKTLRCCWRCFVKCYCPLLTRKLLWRRNLRSTQQAEVSAVFNLPYISELWYAMDCI